MKYLNIDGVRYLWDKIKNYIDRKLSIGLNGEILSTLNNNLTWINPKENLINDSYSLVTSNNILDIWTGDEYEYKLLNLDGLQCDLIYLNNKLYTITKGNYFFGTTISPNLEFYILINNTNITILSDNNSYFEYYTTELINRFNLVSTNKLSSIDISHLNIDHITYGKNMFCDGVDYNDYSLNSKSSLRLINVNNINTSNITTMYGMFRYCKIRTLDLSSFNTFKVTNMQFMFSDCRNLVYLDLSNFDTSNVTNMRNVFSGCKSLTELHFFFDTSNVNNMYNIFANCEKLTTLNLSTFNISNVINMNSMFYNCYNLCNINLNVINEQNNKINYTNSMFSGCRSLTILDLSYISFINVLEASNMFYNCISLNYIIFKPRENFKYTTNFSGMFYQCTSLEYIENISYFNTSYVIDMSNMFNGCKSLTTLDLSSFDTSNVTTMKQMFCNCNSLIDISLFKNSGNVTTMFYMFYNCTSLTNLYISFNDTSNVIDMYGMFSECKSLKNIYFKTPFDMSSCKPHETDTYINLGFSAYLNINIHGTIKNIKENISIYMYGLTNESLMIFINGLANVPENKILKIYSKSYNTLTDDQISIATSKGWSVIAI